MALYAGSKRKEGNERHKGFCKARENRVFSSVCIAVPKNGILRVLDWQIVRMAFADLFLDRRTKEQIFSILPAIKTSVLLFFCPIQKQIYNFRHKNIRTNFFHSCTPLKLLFLCPIQKPDFPPLTPLILVFLYSFVEPRIHFHLSPLPRSAFRLRMRPSYFARFTAEPLKSIR